MAESKRQKIVDAIKTRMAQILTANGYETDLGQDVREWETQLLQDEIPASGVVSVCDLIAEAATPRDGRPDPRETIWLMPVQLRLFFPEPTAANVRTGIQDVNRAIRQDDRWKVAGVGLVMVSRPQREGPLIPEESFEIAGAVVEFEVQYITRKFNSEE